MKKKLIAIAAAAVAIVPLNVSPASASTTGGFVFECTAVLPEFPSPSGSGTCGSNAPVGNTAVPAAAVGSVSGTTAAGTPYSVAAAGANNFSAAFNYAEGCVANEPPVLGTASGTATVTGLTGVLGTTQVTATAELDFEWVRVGATAVITFTGGRLTFHANGEVSTPLVLQSTAGSAAFAPLLDARNACPVGQGLRAVVAGSATFGA